MHYTDKITTYPIASRVRGIPGLPDFPPQKDSIIGNAVWIGNNVIVMQGVTIGDGAIIGAGAVVTKDIEPYSVAVGVPARTIRKLFSDEDIAYLENVAWWDLPIKVIRDLDECNAFEGIDAMKGYL